RPLHDGRARGEDRLLREDGGQPRGVLHDVETAAAAAREIFEQRAVVSAPEGDAARGDPRGGGARDPALYRGGDVLGVAPVGEEEHVFQVHVDLAEGGVGLVEGDVDQDAAAARAHAADRLLDRVLVGDGAERYGPLRGGVDVDDPELVAGAEKARRARGGLVGELELRLAADAHAHGSGDVDRDHLGEARAATLLFEVEEDRGDLLEGAAPIAAWTEAAVAAGEQ